MEEALRFARTLEVWIYLILGLIGLFFIRKFVTAWQELRSAVFSLERESAQGRLNQAASALVLLLTIALIEFILVAFVAPSVPNAIPLPTPKLDLLATPTITLPANAASGPAVLSGTPPAIVSQPAASSGCIPGQIEIISPKDGDQVNDIVTVMGTANIANFGFYKFEIKRLDETTWLTIQAGNKIVIAGELGKWNTSQLSPGEYQLSLTVADNQDTPAPPCIITLRVIPSSEPTPGS